MLKDLTSDPFSLSTMLKTELIKIDSIKSRKFKIDKYFQKLYLNFINEKSNALMTRVSLSRIKPGFYLRKPKKWKYFIDNTPREDLDFCINIIRGGHRLELYLYKNFNPDCPYDYMCPDDVVVYRAYKELGIKKVPVIILDNKDNLEESAFKLKNFVSNNEYPRAFIYSSIEKNQDSYFSLVNGKKYENKFVALEKLEQYIESLKIDYRKFHLSNQVDLHYNNIIYSIFVRIVECLKSIRELLEEDLYLSAVSIVRTMYELSLTFYILWVAPSFMSILQLSSTTTDKEWENLWKNESNNNSKEFINVMNYQYTMATNIFNKAVFSPYGESYYRKIYSYLSKIIHHDFSVVARYKNTLIHGDEVVYNEDIKKSIMPIIDSIVTLIYIKGCEDIGKEY